MPIRDTMGIFTKLDAREVRLHVKLQSDTVYGSILIRDCDLVFPLGK